MKLLGQILLWVGFLVGSYFTVSTSTHEGVEFVKGLTPESKYVKDFELIDLSAVEVPENGWHLIPWIWYSIATAVCFAGVVLLHMSRKNTTEKSDKSAASLNEITQALERVIGNTKQLAAESSKLAPSKIVDRIDNVLANDLRIFAEGRDCMTTEHGLTVLLT